LARASSRVFVGVALVSAGGWPAFELLASVVVLVPEPNPITTRPVCKST
jgi:hypothetical protein